MKLEGEDELDKTFQGITTVFDKKFFSRKSDCEIKLFIYKVLELIYCIYRSCYFFAFLRFLSLIKFGAKIMGFSVIKLKKLLLEYIIKVNNSQNQFLTFLI